MRKQMSNRFIYKTVYSKISKWTSTHKGIMVRRCTTPAPVLSSQQREELLEHLKSKKKKADGSLSDRKAQRHSNTSFCKHQPSVNYLHQALKVKNDHMDSMGILQGSQVNGVYRFLKKSWNSRVDDHFQLLCTQPCFWQAFINNSNTKQPVVF